MQIVELGDCSMVIMKDSEDPPWISVGNTYRMAKDSDNKVIMVSKYSEDNSNPEDVVFQNSDEYICTAGRLILFFRDQVNIKFHLHDKVYLHVLATRRSRRH